MLPTLKPADKTIWAINLHWVEILSLSSYAPANWDLWSCKTTTSLHGGYLHTTTTVRQHPYAMSRVQVMRFVVVLRSAGSKSGHDPVRAAMYGVVSASFAIEQVGMPVLHPNQTGTQIQENVWQKLKALWARCHRRTYYRPVPLLSVFFYLLWISCQPFFLFYSLYKDGKCFLTLISR